MVKLKQIVTEGTRKTVRVFKLLGYSEHKRETRVESTGAAKPTGLKISWLLLCSEDGCRFCVALL